ncbi:MAG: four helix bundle protein [Candidatus Paceibacterota bacterium]
MNSHQELIVWQKAMTIVEKVYEVTNKFSDAEKFNLTSQMRRSAVSIPSNISEGHDRKTNGEFGHFLRIAYGSSAELETQILLSNRLGMMNNGDKETLITLLTEIRKMLNKFISTVAKS